MSDYPTWNATVTNLKTYLSAHGVTVPSRLRKDDVRGVAQVVRYMGLDDVRVEVARVGGTLDQNALMTAWRTSRPGMTVEVSPNPVPVLDVDLSKPSDLPRY